MLLYLNTKIAKKFSEEIIFLSILNYIFSIGILKFFEFKIHLKYHIKKAAIYSGYQNVELGSEKVNGIVYGLEYTF